MNWACELTRDAEQDLRRLPKPVQKQVARVLSQMAVNPLQGDVKALHGEEWKGIFRRRIGGYRLLFRIDHNTKIISVVRILIRSGMTYC